MSWTIPGTWIVSLEFHDTLNEAGTFITPIYKLVKIVSVKLNNMPKITQLINGLARNRTEAVCL